MDSHFSWYHKMALLTKFRITATHMVYWKKSEGGDVGMMTCRDGVQQKMLCVTLESLMPQEHFLRQLDGLMDFSFIYQRVESLYSRRGRPSIDPVVVVKMLLLGYMYGIDSERRLEQEVRVNIAYRWFLGIDLDEPVPDHSTFSQLRLAVGISQLDAGGVDVELAGYQLSYFSYFLPARKQGRAYQNAYQNQV